MEECTRFYDTTLATRESRDPLGYCMFVSMIVYLYQFGLAPRQGEPGLARVLICDTGMGTRGVPGPGWFGGSQLLLFLDCGLRMSSYSSYWFGIITISMQVFLGIPALRAMVLAVIVQYKHSATYDTMIHFSDTTTSAS